MKVHQYVLNIQKDTDLSMTDLADINSNIKILHTPSNGVIHHFTTSTAYRKTIINQHGGPFFEQLVGIFLGFFCKFSVNSLAISVKNHYFRIVFSLQLSLFNYRQRPRIHKAAHSVDSSL